MVIANKPVYLPVLFKNVKNQPIEYNKRPFESSALKKR